MENKSYIDAKEVAELLGVSMSKGYKIIKSLNDELKKNGYITLAGKVSRTYFNEKWYGNA